MMLVWVMFAVFQTAVVQAEDTWRSPLPENILLVELSTGTVVIELAPQFAPNHVKNVKLLVDDGFFNGLPIYRSQDNYVVQWGDPNAGNENALSLGKAKAGLEPEMLRKRSEVDFTPIQSTDAYAREVGFVNGFPAASDGENVWMTHCYGAVGIPRGNEPDSGNGSSLYVITGHAPRHLDLNITLVGKVLKGMEHLSSLKRGVGPLGMYADPSEHVPIQSISSPSVSSMPKMKVMNTSSSAFMKHVQSRTNRTEPWFFVPTGKIELCNVGVPVE